MSIVATISFCGISEKLMIRKMWRKFIILIKLTDIVHYSFPRTSHVYRMLFPSVCVSIQSVCVCYPRSRNQQTKRKGNETKKNEQPTRKNNITNKTAIALNRNRLFIWSVHSRWLFWLNSLKSIYDDIAWFCFSLEHCDARARSLASFNSPLNYIRDILIKLTLITVWSVREWL